MASRFEGRRMKPIVALLGMAILSASAATPAFCESHHRHRHRHRSSSIPQRNGGDRDRDNNGGPSDGDGSI